MQGFATVFKKKKEEEKSNLKFGGLNHGSEATVLSKTRSKVEKSCVKMNGPHIGSLIC